jgi:hypothetical protein
LWLFFFINPFRPKLAFLSYVRITADAISCRVYPGFMKPSAARNAGTMEPYLFGSDREL